ncbi:MAG: nuclear transport factor 2 family protein [Oligoflexia bacterium]|nr:nuclear transport factor 2 family protein [Oligoflexia bacterium]
MSNKEMAKSFLQMVAAGDVKTAYDKFVAANFIHHNPYFKGDRQSLMEAMEEASKKNPNRLLDIKHIFEDGNTIITHSHVIKENSNGINISVIHIMHFQNERMVEMWEIGQPILKISPNENGVF